MKTNLRERLTWYRCFIRPKVHCSPEFSFKTLFLFDQNYSKTLKLWNTGTVFSIEILLRLWIKVSICSTFNLTGVVLIFFCTPKLNSGFDCLKLTIITIVSRSLHPSPSLFSSGFLLLFCCLSSLPNIPAFFLFPASKSTVYFSWFSSTCEVFFVRFVQDEVVTLAVKPHCLLLFE